MDIRFTKSTENGKMLSILPAGRMREETAAADRFERALDNDKTRAQIALSMIQQLYALERLLVVLLQTVTGIRLIYKRDARAIAGRIQVYSGLYLSFFLIAHVGAVLLARYVEHLDTNFSSDR